MQIKPIKDKTNNKQLVVSGQWSVVSGARARERGFSLIETVIYAGLLAVIISAVIYSMINIFNTYNRAIAQKEILADLQFTLDTITEEIKFAKNIYTPTSVFDSDSGQISIETQQNPPSGETAGFIDFYLDNGRIYIKKEGQTEIPISSNRTKITKLNPKYLNPANTPEGAQIYLEGQLNSQNTNLATQTIINLTTSAIIRYK